MDGWMDGPMDGWMDGPMDGWTDGLIDWLIESITVGWKTTLNWIKPICLQLPISTTIYRKLIFHNPIMIMQITYGTSWDSKIWGDSLSYIWYVIVVVVVLLLDSSRLVREREWNPHLAPGAPGAPGTWHLAPGTCVEKDRCERERECDVIENPLAADTWAPVFSPYAWEK